MEVCFLSLDADRSYPKRNYNLNDVAQAYETDWANAEYTRGRSFKSTATLYEEWIKYLLGQENQAGASMMQGLRKARKLGGASPVFVDHFEEYAASVQKVLPHLIFTGVDSKKRTLLFDTTGLQLTFNQLSGGEREIAFLIGQIDRFGLKNGLFLIDEPELHLNSDLIRSWVAFLTSTISVGQIWLATHSLEAVESAGQQSTFILERDEESRKVNSVARLDARPVLTALSRAVGTPAFSISKLAFVFIEGAESLGERERFSKLAGTSSSVRFLESGSCNEVVRRLGSVKAVAAAAGQAIRVGGIVDRDFRSTTQMAELKGRGIFFLPVHEVENLFLAPNTLSQLLEQNGKARNAAAAIVQKAADARAGGWIFQYAMATDNAKDFPEIASVAKGRAKAKCWSTLTADTPLAVQQIVDASGFSPNFQSRLSDLLNIGIKTYERRRTEPDLWKVCEGKEVLNDIAHECGFADSSALELAAFALWEKRSDLVPEELLFLRQFVSAI
jgi:AraC-like DNA-binding protein